MLLFNALTLFNTACALSQLSERIDAVWLAIANLFSQQQLAN
jgi:hypothetical protein